MTKLVAVLLLFGVFGLVLRDADGEGLKVSRGEPQSGHAEGILQSIQNASVTATEEGLLVTRKNKSVPVEMDFKGCQGLGVRREDGQWWVLPLSDMDDHISVNKFVWVLPLDAKSADESWSLELANGDASVSRSDAGIKALVNADRFMVRRAEARPHSDPFGNRFALTIAGGKELEDALAGFYWGTMLPLVVEKTMAANFAYSSGYVLSTLKVSSYAGSYPAVDHEFQIKGRLAMGSEADLDVVKRMIELQFKLMKDDPERLSRAPTSVQPDGQREYHVRRNSKDNKHNAAMFPLTGNIEVMEEAWHYYEAKKDAAWLKANIGSLEDAAEWIEASVDQYGRVWSDVYYEDQVIKDGRETQAQAFAAYAFGLLSRMEKVLKRSGKAEDYDAFSNKLAHTLIEPIPMGYWDETNQRFVDWVDRDGKVHDHIHLLANALPVTFGYATAAQAEAVKRLIDENAAQFERFPTFLSAKIAAYDNSEIGDGGPYDLSAAGRYWYWDAAYRESRRQDKLLFDQLKMVSAEGAKDNYFMGERYDMDYVYYIDGKNAHGAEQYYEYPNVYAAVLVSKLLGLTVPADADVSVEPHITSYGSVEFRTPEYALRYSYDKDGFLLKNLSEKRRRFKVDLSGLGDGKTDFRLVGKPGANSKGGKPGSSFEVDVPGEGDARWILER